MRRNEWEEESFLVQDPRRTGRRHREKQPGGWAQNNGNNEGINNGIKGNVLKEFVYANFQFEWRGFRLLRFL